MNLDLTGKIAVVTGASRGVGREVVLALAAHGATVAAVARDAAKLRETASLAGPAADAIHVITADVTDNAALAALPAQVTGAVGTPHILVNAAGVFGPIAPIKDSDATAWIETLQINTIAPYLTCRAFVPGMIAAGWGRIVNVSSAAALHTPGPYNSAYAVSKVALNQFTRHLAVELDGTGVTANVIHPGDVKTDMWGYIRDEADKMGPEGEGYRQWVQWVAATGGDPPHKAADLVLRLVSTDAGSVSGQFLWIEDGLQAPIPSWGEPGTPLPWG